MISRIMKYGFGISVGLVLLSIVSFWVVLDGPKALWYKIFPIVEYDNLEVVLEVDGEVVTIRGTARCSITPSSGYSGGPNPARRKRWGGDATVVLKDGRALVVPYTNRDWCYSGRGARGFMRKWWDTYKKADFDERVPLEGHFPLLILDNGDAPTQIDLLLGPGYYAQPNAEIRLVSSVRWASKEGPETYPHLEWLMGRDGKDVRRNKWMGGVVTELSLSDTKSDAGYQKYLPDLNRAIFGIEVLRRGADLKAKIDLDGNRISQGAVLKNTSVTVNKNQTAFRVNLLPYDLYGDQMSTIAGNLAQPYCAVTNNGWDAEGLPELQFNSGDRIERLWSTRNIFLNLSAQKILVGSYECVAPTNITNRFHAMKSE